MPDECDVLSGASQDCNSNGLPDECDVTGGESEDCNSNNLPDECDPDCNGNSVPDDCDLLLSKFIQFSPVQEVGVGNFPNIVMAGDLNGDGQADLVATNNAGPPLVSVSILLNGGHRSFTVRGINVNQAAKGLALADLDQDGDLDVAGTGTQKSLSPTVWLLFNMGSASFEAVRTLAAESPVLAITAGDLDQDGRVDLAAAGGQDNNVRVFLSLGGGAFAAPVKYPVAGETGFISIVSSDIDGDHHLDLAMGAFDDSRISVLWSSGLGFPDSSIFAVASEPQTALSADVDGDGQVDLITPNPFSDNVSVLFNEGASTFVQRQFSVGDTPMSVEAMDMDGDGKVDLATSNRDSLDVSLLLNQGNRMMAHALSFSLGDRGFGITADEFDGDGQPDIAAVGGSGQAWLLWNENRPTDCNKNGTLDDCDIALGTSLDQDGDRILDECRASGGLQLPGDATQDGGLDLSDAIWLLGHLFLGTNQALPCEGSSASRPEPGDQALFDSNGDGLIDLSDAVSVLGFLFLGSSPPLLGTECVPIAGCPDNSEHCSQ